MCKYYHIVTFGCQMNLHDSEKIGGFLRDLGYESCEKVEDADIVVFNTCCIRENAENHAYGNIGMMKKLKAEKRGMIVAVGGCLTQQPGKAEYIRRRFPFVDIIFGTNNLDKFKDYILEHDAHRKPIVRIEDWDGTVPEGDTPVRTSYPNAWVNITYGCNNFCTYCIVPYVRGRERSRRSENILTEVRGLIDDGYSEITFLGQNVNSYNNGSDDIKFPDLLRKVSEIDGKFRVRFMTSHPKDFSEDLAMAISESPHVCHCVHLPVQSGSDRILRAMNRHYTRDDYLRKIDVLKRYVPDCAITTDLIVGFPGETDEDFRATLDLVKEVGYSSAFTFVFSPRQGTPAAEMEGQIPEDVSKQRIVELVELVNSQTRAQSAEYRGRTVEILCEGFDDKKKLYLGRDEYGRMGYFTSDSDEKGNFVNIRINSTSGISLMGDKV